MAGAGTGPGVMPAAGMKPAPNVKTPGQMFAGGTPNFNERTGMREIFPRPGMPPGAISSEAAREMQGGIGGFFDGGEVLRDGSGQMPFMPRSYTDERTRQMDEELRRSQAGGSTPAAGDIIGGTLGGTGYGEFPLGTAGPRVDPSDPNYVPPPASGGKGGGVQAPVSTPPQAPQPTSFPVQGVQPAQPNVYQQASGGLQQAMGATRREMGFQPSRVQGFGYQSGDVTPTIGPYAGDIRTPRMGYAGDVTGMGYAAPSIAQNIGQFVNPFEQQVVSGALGDIERQRQMQANQLAAQFQGARAFGGSRQAIQEAELARSAMEQGASTAAALRQQGFGQALQAAGQQAQMGARASEFGLGQGLQAQLANQAARQRFGEFGAQQGMQAALANQAARQRFGEFAGGQSMQAQLANQAAQARAREFGLGQSMQAQLANQAAGLSGSQQRMGAASQLANLANLGFGMGQTVQQQMAQQGAMQQQLQQQIMNAARQQFEGFRNYPAQALGYYAQALGATPTPQSSTTSRQPGLFDYLTLGASMFPGG